MTTLEKLRAKATDDSTRMPSLREISKMLTELNVPHTLEESQNVVERRSKGNRYVNSRRMGKKGLRLEIPKVLIMDSSESYYSWNSQGYAQRLVKYLDSK